MLSQLGASVKRFTSGMIANDTGRNTPLVRVGGGGDDAVVVAQSDIGMLRGVTSASADLADCTCPEPCERDHANE